MATVIHKGVKLPFDVPCDAEDIPAEYFAILPPIPARANKKCLRLAIDSDTGELEWVYNPYYDY